MPLKTIDMTTVKELNTPPSSYGMYSAYKSIRTNVENIVGERTYVFTDEFFETINTFITNDNKYLLTLDQQKLIDRYFSIADALTDEGANTDVSTLINELAELDQTLSKYTMEE